MAEKEFKKLSKIELIDIIYQLQINEKLLEDEIVDLKKQLEDRRICLSECGSIAEASMAIHHMFEVAQQAADQYVSEVKTACEEKLSQEESTKNEKSDKNDEYVKEAYKKAEEILRAACKERDNMLKRAAQESKEIKEKAISSMRASWSSLEQTLQMCMQEEGVIESSGETGCE